MKYTLFPCGKGYITEQTPDVVDGGDIAVTFDGIDLSADKRVAMFTTEVAEGSSALATLYRDIDATGRCVIPISKLDGEITVTVSVDGKRYFCGGLFIRHDNYGCFISPINVDLTKEVVASRKVEAELEAAKIDLVSRVEALEDKLERLLEGYDIE